MSLSDPIADLLTRIRNAQAARKSSVSAPSSKLKSALLDVCQREGYIHSYECDESVPHKPVLTIQLKYVDNAPAICEINRVSKPGRRIYAQADKLPRFYNNLGITILSTPFGLLSDAEARRKNTGGEVLCQIF